jgi:hypothetical protein
LQGLAEFAFCVERDGFGTAVGKEFLAPLLKVKKEMKYVLKLNENDIDLKIVPLFPFYFKKKKKKSLGTS